MVRMFSTLIFHKSFSSRTEVSSKYILSVPYSLFADCSEPCAVDKVHVVWGTILLAILLQRALFSRTTIPSNWLRGIQAHSQNLMWTRTDSGCTGGARCLVAWNEVLQWGTYMEYGSKVEFHRLAKEDIYGRNGRLQHLMFYFQWIPNEPDYPASDRELWG